MDIYHIWFNLKPGVRDVDFARRLDAYLGRLAADGAMAGHRLTRCKLGFRPASLREFHLMIEVRDLAQLEQAFGTVASRSGPVEGLHAAVNQDVEDIFFALYRDFPDSVRVEGEERF